MKWLDRFSQWADEVARTAATTPVEHRPGRRVRRKVNVRGGPSEKQRLREGAPLVAKRVREGW